jgi:hypothetical protein
MPFRTALDAVRVGIATPSSWTSLALLPPHCNGYSRSGADETALNGPNLAGSGCDTTHSTFDQSGEPG